MSVALRAHSIFSLTCQTCTSLQPVFGRTNKRNNNKNLFVATKTRINPTTHTHSFEFALVWYFLCCC